MVTKGTLSLKHEGTCYSDLLSSLRLDAENKEDQQDRVNHKDTAKGLQEMCLTERLTVQILEERQLFLDA